MPLGVRWISWVPGDGYGDAALRYVRALDALDVPVTWTPLSFPPELAPATDYRGEMQHLAHRTIEHDVVVAHLPLDRGIAFTRDDGKRRTLAYTTWEIDRVPPGWAAYAEEFDAVLVPSRFNLGALVAAGCRVDAHVVPHCVPAAKGRGSAPYEGLGDRFVFYTVGTWSTRKAVGETVAAFLDAFDAHDDVALVVKTSDFNQQAIAQARRGLTVSGPSPLELTPLPAFTALFSGRRNVPEVGLIAEHVRADQIQALHAHGDCFVSLTRSEGFGLCIADALAAGNPAVVTGWGGHLDYLGADYPLLVDYDLIPTSDDVRDDWFEPQKAFRWAKARHDHAVELMRWVADHRDDAAVLGQRVGERVARELAPDAVARRLLTYLAPR